MRMPSAPSAVRSLSRRRLLVLAAGGVVVLVLLAGFVLWSGDPDTGRGRAGAASAARTTAPWTSPPAPATPEVAGPTDQVDDEAPALAVVGLRETAAVGDGITGALTAVEAIDGAARGPGNVGGPALRITVRIENGSAQPVSLDAVAVELYHGAEMVPASPLDDRSQQPFAGTVAPGEAGEGRYVFTVPVDERGAVTVKVGYQAGAPFLVFSGSVA